jgi:DNA polymerase-4
MKVICRDCLNTGAETFARCPTCGSPRVIAHAELGALNIAHLDCDAFYASVEKRDRPELRDKPVIVGGGVRGVVTTACYIARQYGARSAMPMFKALKACPDAVVVKPDFAKYKEASARIFGRIRQLTPLVQTLSLDEAWIDLTGTERLNGGPPALQLARVQREIEQDTGLTVSIGLAANKFLAKVASDIDKPRGFCVIGSEAQSFLAPRPASVLPGVGPALYKSLQAAGFSTVGDLAAADPKTLVHRWGEYGLRLHHLAHGRDTRVVDPSSERKGMSAETTFNSDLRELSTLEDELWPLCEKLARKARAEGVAGQAVVLKLKGADFKLITRRRTLPLPTRTARTLFSEGRELLRREATGKAYRLIGIGLADLVEADTGPGELFTSGESRALKTETAIDRLRAKFGKDAVVAGRALSAKPQR